MAFGRMLLAMEADGLVTVAHMGRVREPSCRLTARGDQHARALCDLPGPIATLVLVDDVVRLAGVGRWCGERDLGAGDGESATDLAERALPGLVRGWLVCGDTARGGLFYAATEAGATADEESAGEWPDWTSAAADLYYQTLQSAQARLAEADVGGEIGPIPLSGCTVTGDSAQGWEV
jgi:hypothetical protein